MASNVNDATEAPATEAPSDNDGFVTLETRRYMYNVDKCKEKPLQGFLLNMSAMSPMRDSDGTERPWYAFVIRTTAPTLGINREGELVDVPADSIVLIPATHELTQFLMRPAFDPERIWEVKIKPSKKIGLDRRRQMWVFDLGTKPKPVQRFKFGVAGLIGDRPSDTQVVETTGRSAEEFDDIPF